MTSPVATLQARTFATVAAVAFVQWIVGVRAFGDSALLVALYTVASTQPLRTTLIAAGVLEVGIVLAVARWAGHSDIATFIGLSGLATAAGVLGTNVRHRRALLASLQERARQLEHERDQQGRLSAAAERSRIARELHDVIAHAVSVMTVQAGAAEEMLKLDPARAVEPVRAVQETGRRALVEMKRLVGVLREDDEEIGLAPQPGLADIERLVEQVRGAGLRVELRLEGERRPVPIGVDLSAYRVVQEALTNALKHARNASAVVTIRYGESDLAVEVTDDGRPGVDSAGGHGLIGMRERVGIFGGTFSAGPSESGGFAVRALLPLESTA